MNTSGDQQVAAHPLDEAETALQGRAAMAKALGVTPGAIGNWKVRGVPIKYCVRIERLVPTVTRQRLRPMDYPEIWPDLAEATAPVQERRDLTRPSRDAGTDWDRRRVPTGADGTLARAPAGEG